ncbi:uncharacterized protein C9orf57 homolog [Piliocolobus tephrosceles]|uniref:uncharacterized protein C9orf57 homolog n=1 Tax=Piliocolobus tephrosceles TaxID=591936 RepID=UPI001300F5DE|nr:uncharacterized protein C9orf57 homolog [Piliocolobus tephrosceles]
MTPQYLPEYRGKHPKCDSLVVFCNACVCVSTATGTSTYVGGLICRACNLAVPFHGCLLDLGTCQTKPAQYCKKVVHVKGGIEWYSVKGCTKNVTECFERTNKLHELVSTHCCHSPLCNF